jgi:hypothetical protein
VKLAAVLFGLYVASRFAHFFILMTARTHDARATTWTIGAVVIYAVCAMVLLHAVQTWG